MIDETIFDKYLGKPGELELVDEKGNVDRFKLEQLGIEYVGDLMTVQDALAKFGRDPENVSKYLTSEITEKMNNLVTTTLKSSFPDVNEEKLGKFARSNFLQILSAIFRINGYGFDKTAKIQQVIEKSRKGASSAISENKADIGKREGKAN